MTLVIVTGPIAAGKNTVARHLADRLARTGRSVVITDLDDVVDMVVSTGPRDVDLWPAARRAHGALVGEWLRDGPDVVVAVGPFFTAEDHDALLRSVPIAGQRLEVLLEAPVAITWARAQADPGRGVSREYDFHHTARSRYETLRAGIPADLVLDSTHNGPDRLAAAIAETLSE